MQCQHLCVVALLRLGGVVEAREGAAVGQLVVEGQQAIRLQRRRGGNRKMMEVRIQSGIMVDGGAQEEGGMGVRGQGK